MKNFLGIGVSVGVLAGLWTQVSIELELVAFIAWACYFAAGGRRDGFTKGLAANLAGVFWGWVASQVLEQLTFTGAVAIAVTVVALILCVQAAAAPLSFIPGAFAGTAVFFGTAFDTWGTVIALVAGACLGWVSDVLGARIQALVDRSAPAPEVEPPARAA
ncbi:DUF1097 domain-containing protein [Nocardioides sp. MAHUQ-72]|uniref:DUF1097 domain-containing protein n=1 Tax=unclassified Nocardioides TaxID=2615069 RepID=UPI0036120BC1